MDIPVVSSMHIENITTDWGKERLGQCLVLRGADHEFIAALPLKELAEALAPFIPISKEGEP